MKRAVIMQPTFLPWLGYFALLDAADEFVYLDDVQFSRGSWQSRNRVKGPNGPVLLSLDIARKPSMPMIMNARLANTGRLKKLLKAVSASLGDAPFRDLVERLLSEAFTEVDGSLATLNISLIERIAVQVGIETRCVRSSNLGIPPMDRSERLLAICRHLGADEYLSPIGSADYLAVADPFDGTEIVLRFQNFDHPGYPQAFGAFTSHLAAIDALAWTGPERFLSLVRSGVGSSLTLDEVTATQKSTLALLR